MNQLPPIFLILSLVLFSSACSDDCCREYREGELAGWVGSRVRVQFRRDALGAAASLPVSPTTGEINGASTHLVGKLLRVEAAQLILGPEDRPRWIPREVILFVERNP